MTAFLVEYKGPKGSPCPPAVICFDGGEGEDIGKLAPKAQELLVRIRGGGWKPHDVTITAMKYLGPWFKYERPKIGDPPQPLDDWSVPGFGNR